MGTAEENWLVTRSVEIADRRGLMLQRRAGLPTHLGACIFMTAIGCDVLARFGIEAHPFPVAVAAFNASYVRWMDAGCPGGVRAGMPADAWCVADEAFPGAVWDPRLAPAQAGGFVGHLVIHLPHQTRLVDLDLRQYGNQAHDVIVSAAGAFEWPAGADEQVVPLARGGRLHVRAQPGLPRYRDYRWMFPHERAAFVPAIVAGYPEDSAPATVETRPISVLERDQRQGLMVRLLFLAAAATSPKRNGGDRDHQGQPCTHREHDRFALTLHGEFGTGDHQNIDKACHTSRLRESAS